MKITMTLLSLLAALTVYGQSQVPAGDLAGNVRSGEFRATPESDRIFGIEQPNETRRGRLSYSGIFITAIKARRPLQLINPAAPPELGSAELNTARDAITQKPMGLKFLAISF